MNDFVNAFKFMGNNLDLLVTKTVEHLELSGAAIAVALAIALPIGLWLGHRHRGSFIAINAANVGRALPSLAIIAIGIGILGIGFVNVMFALIVLAVPPILTNAYLGVDQVDRDMVQAAEGMGMRPWQVFGRLRRGDRDVGRHRRWRRAGRDHRQPSELQAGGRDRRGDLGRGARPPRGRRVRRAAARGDSARAAPGR
jgi:hypothetical protein